ncbi:MAG: glycosyltransferase family 4 protein [Phycisphaerales bacterium]
MSTNVLEFIENGVDLSQWPAAPRARTPGPETVFAFFGRLVDWKGCDTLLRALARLGADTPARVLILGDGAERANLETLADRLGVRSRVEFAGWLSQSRCAERLSEADVLVLPSVLECGGAVVLEAMAKGLPVIAADWGGPADYLDPSCGVLVTPDSPEHLVAGVAAAMATLARSPELRERMGRAGRAKVESQFSWERRVERMLRVYHAVAGSCPADRPVRSIRLSLPAGLSEPEVAVQGAPVPAA